MGNLLGQSICHAVSALLDRREWQSLETLTDRRLRMTWRQERETRRINHP